MDNLLKIKNIKSITVDDLSKNYKIEYIAKFQNAYKEDLLSSTDKRKTKQQICKENGISDTTLKRYMKDLGMKSFYRHNYPEHTNKNEENSKEEKKKTKPKSKTSKRKDNSNMDDKYEKLNNNL